MKSSGVLRRVALVRTDVSEELSTSFIRVTKIGELGTTLAVTSNRRTLRRNTNSPNYKDLQTCKMVSPLAVYMITRISKEYVAYFFRVEHY
jgi:uncharacterized protein YqjF (DUF2071 family)